jgi:hypothetical protein
MQPQTLDAFQVIADLSRRQNEFIAEDSLHALVDGKINGKALKIDYNYKRIQ